jgi:hypothetical protein
VNKHIPLAVTADEAVARLINIDYIPAGFTLLDMTAAFLEEAQADYENARVEQVKGDKKSLLVIRSNVCEDRHRLAQQLLDSFARELESPDCAVVRVADEPTVVARFDLASVSDWAFENFGIGIAMPSDVLPSLGKTAPNARWEDVTIKISPENTLGVKVGGGKFKSYSLADVGLMGKKRDTHNAYAIVLEKLSVGIKFPPGKFAENADKKSISCLRRILMRLTDIPGDPFLTFNAGDGWKPRFKLIDGQRLAELRAAQNEPNQSYDDETQYRTDNSYGTQQDLDGDD